MTVQPHAEFDERRDRPGPRIALPAQDRSQAEVDQAVFARGPAAPVPVGER